MSDLKDRSNEEQAMQGFKHREILEALNDAIHVVDKNLKIIYQNPALSKWLESLEMNPAVSGKKIIEAFPFLSAETLNEYNQVFTTGEVHFTTEYTKLEGREVYTEITKIPLLREGTAEHVATIIRDVTEHHVSQRSLRKSEAQYRNLYSNLSDAVFQTDVQGNIMLAGDKSKDFFGYTSDELVGTHFSKLVHPSMRGQLAKEFAESLETGSEKSEGFEAIGLRKDGSTFTFHITNTIRYVGTKPSGYQSLIRDVTERKKAEDALQEEHDRAEMYLNIAGVILVALDSEGRINLINQKGVELLGYDEEELQGKNWFEIVIPEDVRSGTREVFSLLMKGEAKLTEKYENRVVTKSGQERLIAWTNRYLVNKEGGIVGTLSSGEDITEIRKAEDELRESERHLKMVYDTILDGILVTDEKMNIVSCNPAAEKILGYEHEELLGQPYQVIIDDAMTTGPDAKIREEKLYNDGYIEQEDYYFKRKNGEIFPTSFSASLLRDEQGNFNGMLGSIRDTTEIKRTHEALRAEKEKYEVLFDAAPIAIGVSREDGEILDVNWLMQEMLGYTKEELKQKTAIDVYTKREDRDGVRESLDKEGKVRDSDVRMRRKDGTEIDVLLNIDYIRYENELARLSTMRDITELNKTKIDLEAARARTEFFNDLMAHDINNVHQGILVGAELLLREDELPHDARRYAEAISDQVNRGIQLIENVHKLSRMDADADVALQRLDLYGVIANAILLVQHAFPESEVKIDIKFKPEEVIVLADEFLIDLFYNIVHNAMKYTIPDKGIIEISVNSSDEEGFVQVAIADKGPGIPDERKGDVFSRLEKGRTLGSGMGLTLVKRIAERYQGIARVEDRVPGTHMMGAKFIVKLPKIRTS